MTSNTNVMVCLTKSCEVWLLNTGENDATLGACELFGFGLGTCAESPAGALFPVLFSKRL